jgi:hypothetical protein
MGASQNNVDQPASPPGTPRRSPWETLWHLFVLLLAGLWDAFVLFIKAIIPR